MKSKPRVTKNLLQLDLDVDASGQVELHQCVDGLVSRIDDVHQALMGADLELVARGLVDVWLTQDVKTLDAGRQGNRPFDHGAGALGGLDDFLSGLVDQAIVKCFQTNTDFLVQLGNWGRHGIFP